MIRAANFLQYYNQYKNQVLTYFWYRVNFDMKTAEDLSSEVFIKACKNFQKFDEKRSFKSWIFTIAHNHLVNHYKSVKREVPLEEAENTIGSSDQDMNEKLEVESVMHMISNMEGDDREPLLLRFVEGFSNSEIAEMLGKEEGTIRTRISRSLSKLRKNLNKLNG